MGSKLRDFFTSIKKAKDVDAYGNEDNPDLPRQNGTKQPVPTPNGFEYAYKYWDKLRPIDLPKTGLGEALKAYEAAKLRVGTVGHIHEYFSTQTALKDVEDARTKAISKCGLPHFKPIKKVLEAVDPSVEAGVLSDIFRTKLTEIIDEMVQEAGENFNKLELRVKKAKLCADAIKAGTATTDIKKFVYRLITTESTLIVPGIDDIGQAAAFRGKRAAFAKDFPEMVKRFDDEVVAKLQEAVDKGNEYRAMLDDLDNYEDALSKDLGKS